MKLSHLLCAGIVSAAVLLTGTVSTALAAAPQANTAAPGFYRIKLGDFEVTALSDGTVALPVDKLLTNTTAEKTHSALEKYHQHSPLDTSVNAYLINTGSKLILIDSGAGGLFGPTLGKLPASLQAAGYRPEQIDEIYITHMHADHVGGLADGEQMRYPNAVVRVDRHDADFWLSPQQRDAAPAEQKNAFNNAMSSLNPYVKSAKFLPFDGDTKLVAGITAIAAPGHTPGHSIYKIESKGQVLMLWGDLMHVAAVQFDQPSVTIAFDSDSKAAAVERQKAYAEATRQGYLVGAAHLSFPGLGYVRSQDQAYAWTPINYAPAP